MLGALYKAVLLLKPTRLAVISFWRPLVASFWVSAAPKAIPPPPSEQQSSSVARKQVPPARFLSSRRGRNHPSNNHHPRVHSVVVRRNAQRPDDRGEKRRHFSTTKSSNSNSTTICSRRGQEAVQLLPSYLADARAVAPFDAASNPTGPLQLSVAEWKGLEDWLVPALNGEQEPIPADCIYYQPTAGRPGLRHALAQYAERLLDLAEGRLSTTKALEGLVVGAGCNAVLENLCICLAEPGDAVLIPTPYYAAFEFDLQARAALTVEPVVTAATAGEQNPTGSHQIDPALYYPNRSSLDAAYDCSLAKGHAPRILLLCHPQNPLGICYPPAVVKECIDWCRERQVHLISDEIYAGSVHGNDANADFVSALKLADEGADGLGDYVHWVYALSKDFALSGLRVGAVYTENEQIQLPLQKLNDFCQISSQTQEWVRHVLTKRMADGNSQQGGEVLWTDQFRRENHRRLRRRCQKLTQVLAKHEIPYLPPTAGLFCWIDLSQFLPDAGEMDDSERERQLYLELIHEYGLLLTPGLSMRHAQPGFFRCVFTAATDEEFALSCDRFATLFEAKKEQRGSII